MNENTNLEVTTEIEGTNYEVEQTVNESGMGGLVVAGLVTLVGAGVAAGAVYLKKTKETRKAKKEAKMAEKLRKAGYFVEDPDDFDDYDDVEDVVDETPVEEEK